MAQGSTVAEGLAGIASVTGAGTAASILLRQPRPHLPTAHVLASPDDPDPLPGALNLSLGGLTVPVTAGPHGELYLGPGAPQPGRTLRRLVLNPLFARAKSRGGRLFRDQKVPFRLVVEFAGRNRDEAALLRAYRMLDQQLRDHAALLSRCEEQSLVPGAVTVSVSGIVDVRELLAPQPIRYAFADGSFDDVGSPGSPSTLVPMISEPWSRRFGWDGREQIPAEERHQLHAMVEQAHEDGRTVRISGLPRGSRRARRAIWSELAAAGVDVIAGTERRALARYLRRHPVASWVPRAPLPSKAVRRTRPAPSAPRPERRHEPV